MAINLELPKKMHAVIDKAHQGAAEMMRPIARKYDLNEHAYPVELDTLANLFEGAVESNGLGLWRRGIPGRRKQGRKPQRRQHGSGAASVGSQLG